MCPRVPARIGVWKYWFLWKGENQSTRRKTSRNKGESQQQTQPTYGFDAEIWCWATLVGGECYHHYVTIALLTSQEWFTDLTAIKALWLEWTLLSCIQARDQFLQRNYCYSYLKPVIDSADLAFLASRQTMFLIGTVRGWVRLHCTCSWRRLFCSYSFFLLR